MPTEVWGYRIGDHVEVRLEDRWEHGVVHSFDIERNIYVALRRAASRVRVRLTDPRRVRRFLPPSTPESVERWLEDG